jgi:hypothetical protein
MQLKEVIFQICTVASIVQFLTLLSFCGTISEYIYLYFMTVNWYMQVYYLGSEKTHFNMTV